MGYIGQAPANKAVKTADIEDSAITAAKIADGTVVAGELASDSVTTAKILNANVTTAKLAADAIDSTKLADDAVGAEHIADNAVGLAALASGTDGNIISYDASGNPVAIATGNSGQVLTSGGAGAAPSFAAGGGAWTLLETEATTSGGATDFTSMSSDYHTHVIMFDLVRTVVDDDTIKFMVFDTGGNTLQTYYANQYFKVNETGTTAVATSGTYSTNPHNINLWGGVGSGSNEGFSGQMYFTGLTDANDAALWWGNVQVFRHNDEYSHYLIQGRIANTVVTQIRFYGTSGNWEAGNMRLYGIK